MPITEIRVTVLRSAKIYLRRNRQKDLQDRTMRLENITGQLLNRPSSGVEINSPLNLKIGSLNDCQMKSRHPENNEQMASLFNNTKVVEMANLFFIR